jgi:tetratricopeptide (TPR) repeat protein
VATTLNNLGTVLGDLQRLEAAEEAFREALEIRRRLAAARPEVYAPDVATTLNNLGNVLWGLQRLEAAEESYREALEIRRRLAGARPEVYAPKVATTLNNLGLVLRDLQRPEAAEEACREALDIYRRLAEARPEVYAPYVAGTLNNLGTMLWDLQRLEAAEEAYREAVQFLAEAYTRRPALFRERWSRYLRNWVGTLRERRGAPAAAATLSEWARGFDPSDPVVGSMLLVCQVWAQDWEAVRAGFQPASEWATGPAIPEVRRVAEAFVEKTLDPHCPAEPLRSLRSDAPEHFREAFDEALMAAVRARLPRAAEDVPGAITAAQRMEGVFGRENLAGKALLLLEGAVAYIQAGQQEKALLHLPVELRRLILETLEPFSRQK